MKRSANRLIVSANMTLVLINGWRNQREARTRNWAMVLRISHRCCQVSTQSKTFLVVYSTFVASQSIMFETSCLLSNIEALYLPDICDCGRKYTATMPLLAYVSFYKNACKRGMINTYLQILLFDFSPQ